MRDAEGSSPGIEVHLRKDLGGFELDVAWSAGRGVTVLFGYSGTGKSLTLGAIAGLVRPDAGRVSLSGRVLFDSSDRIDLPPQRRGLGLVSQGLALFPHMTVRENIAFGLKGDAPSARSATVERLAEELRIADTLEHRPHRLSGGQRQRVAIARALAPRPAALLLDEPFSALDLPVRRELRSLIRSLRERLDIPVLLVTHDPYEAFEMAETLVVYAGEGIVQYGLPGDLLADPGTPAVRRLLRAADVAVPVRLRPLPPTDTATGLQEGAA